MSSLFRKAYTHIVLPFFMRLIWVILICTILQNVSSDTTVHASSVPTNGLIGEWRLDGNADDDVGGHHGYPVNMNWTSPHDILSAQFHDTNYINIPDNTILNGLPEITVSTWITWSGASTTQLRGILGNQGHYAGDLHYQYISTDGSNQVVYFYIAGTSPGYITQDLGPIELGKWYLLTTTYNQSSGTISYYLNGELKGSQTFAYLPLISIYTALDIGRVYDDGRHHLGNLSGLQIYDRELSQPEIQAMYTGAMVSTFSFISSIPTESATGVGIDGPITLNFSNSLDQGTVPGNIILKKTYGDIIDTVALSYSGNSIVFHAISPLEYNTSYTVELKTGLRDTNGSILETPTTFSFTTVVPLVYNPYISLPTLPDSVQYLLFPQNQASAIIEHVEKNAQKTVQDADELDPVDLATGDFTYNNTLLHLDGDGLDYELTLQYRSRTAYNSMVGNNWDHNYNKRLQENTGGSVTYFDGKLGQYVFVPSGSGFAHMDALNAELTQSGGVYMILFDDGTEYVFASNNKIASLTNKYNQSLNFAYNNSGALTTVTDTLGRTITYTYDTTDHLTSVAESGGKSIEFAYYGSGELDGGLHDLKGLTIKNGLETKTIGFTYYTNMGDASLDHNIHKLIDSKGQVYVENIYDTNDRVLSQKYGDDIGTYVYTLADIHEDDTPTTVGIGTVIGTYVAKNRATNRNGNVTEYTYDRMGNVLERATILQGDITVTTRYNYDALGRLTEEILPNGGGTKYAHDALGNKAMIRKKADMTAVDDDTVDIVTRLTYSGSKNTLSEVVDPLGKITQFTTDTHGNITAITEQDASGTVLRNSQFVYDGQGNLIESTDARGAVTKMAYTDGRLMTQTRGYGTSDATTTSYTYDVYGNPLTVTDGRGNMTAFTYDAYDRLKQTLTPEGIVSEFTYDANNNKTRTSNAQLVADTVYNLLDKPTTLTADIDANQRATLSYTYDANENLLTTTYPNGQVEARMYDALDRLVQKNIQGSTTHTTSYTYDQNGNILTETKDGQSTTFTYDGYDRLISTTDPNSTKTLLAYDKRGNILTTTQRDSTDTLIQETTHTYDTLGRITSSTEQSLDGGADRTTTYTYDSGDNILTMTDARGNTTTYTYDTLGRQATITLPSGLVTSSVYDDNSNIIESRIQHDGITLTTTSAYDRDNRKTSSTDASGNTTHYEYNSLSQIVTVTDPSGVPTHYTYDYRGNIKTETRAGKTITKSYDVMGNLTSLTDANDNTTSYTYNGNNELITETLSDGVQVRYTYDTRGNIRTKTDPNGTITTYTYDSIDRITRKDYTLGVGVGGVTYEAYTYDALGRLISTNNSASNQTSYTYDTLGNLITETSGGKTITYTYDAVGNKLTMQTPSGRTLSYTYDTMNRLTAVGESGTTIASYAYDGLNLTLETLGNGITTNYGYDSGNRMSQVGADTLTYDANSNIMTKGIESYTYDIYNQLTETMYGDTRFGTGMQGQAYEYDLMGNRINEQNIRIVTRTNKKTGTTTEIQRNKVWNYTTNGLNQYTDVLTQSGTILVSTGVVATNTGTTTNTGVTSTGGLLTDSGSTNRGTTDTESSTDTGATSTGTVETSTPEILSNTGTTTDTGTTSTGDTLETNTGTTESSTDESSTGSTTPVGESGIGEVDTLSIPETNTGTITDTGSTDTESIVMATLTGDTDTTTMLIASDIILADTGATNTGGVTDTGATTDIGATTDSGAVTDTGTLTDTGTIENPIVDTGALQGRLLYDENGNIVGNTINNKKQFEYIYDAQNRMIQVNRYNDITGKEVLISFTYDALGRRTSKKVANVIYEYVYSGNDVIEEVQSNVNPTSGVKVKKEMREYTYGARGTDDIVSVRYSTYTRQNKQDILSTTGDYYYEKNHLGSIIRITSSTGAIVDEYSYTVFGKAYRKNVNGIYKPVSGSNDSPIGNTRLFTGREYDREVSLYYMRARYYDAGLGRFISRDPIGMKDDVNLYTYVANNSMKYVDRFGKEKVLIITGKPGSEAERAGFQMTSYYQYKDAIERGIKPENIVQINNDVMTPDEFNQAVSAYLGNIKQIIYISHGGPDETGDITSTNISQLHPLKIDANDNPTLFLISCQTGRGDNSIAQQLSNKLQIEVTAGDENIRVYDDNDLTLLNKIIHPTRISKDPGEPFVIDSGIWHTFSPI